MPRTTEIDVLVSEVGPRDGLQSVPQTMSTAAKRTWIQALADSGLREIEVGSFVPRAAIPQLSDTAEVVAAARNIPDLTVVALAPNLTGAQRAAAAGAHTISMPVSASHQHSQNNLRRGIDDAIAEVGRVAALRDAGSGFRLDVGVATAFGCTLEGPVPQDRVVDIALRLVEAGADSVGLSDTTGYANPTAVRELFTKLRHELGDRVGAAHLHNTRGQGLANVVAALDAGVRTFDASQAGLGGCPWVSGATGNIVTEDLVFLLEAMGWRTGVDLDSLIAARAVLAEALPGEPLYGSVPDAGLPLGFTYAGKSGS